MTTWNQTADFEEGDLSDFDATSGTGLSADGAAAKNGSYGFKVAIPGGDTTARYGRFSGPSDETTFTAECWVNFDGLTMANATAFQMLSALMDAAVNGTTGVFRTFIAYTDADGFYLTYGYNEDSGGLHTGNSSTGLTGWQQLRWVWSTGAGTGYYRVYRNSVLEYSVDSIDNDQRLPDLILFGYAGSTQTTTSGNLYMDDCQWSQELALIHQGAGMMFWM